MSSSLNKYKDDLNALIVRGDFLLHAIQYECHPEEFERQIRKRLKNQSDKFLNSLPSFSNAYQDWYSEAKVLVKLILPDRLDDFVKLYEKPKSRKEIRFGNYVIEDYLQNLSVNNGFGEEIVGPRAAIPQFQQQHNILKSVQKRFKSSLFDIRQLVQVDIFDSELEATRELIKKGYLRAAGVIAGVVLEKHLAQVCLNHRLNFKKKNLTMADFNDALKNNGVIDTPQWRGIQHLGDLRNLCSHNKGRDPNKEEVEDLVDGVTKITRTLF